MGFVKITHRGMLFPLLSAGTRNEYADRNGRTRTRVDNKFLQAGIKLSADCRVINWERNCKYSGPKSQDSFLLFHHLFSLAS